MLVRSRAVDRSLGCSKYALSRMDKMVTDLALAEEAFHQSREKISSEREGEDGQGQGQHRHKQKQQKHQHQQDQEDQEGEDSSLEDGKKGGYKGQVFCHLGDLSNLDLIYKLALDLARGNDNHGSSSTNN
ncbi:unnamed protein product, partial [Pylaiella littoralis]